MDEKEKEFVKKINIDKAKNKTKACIFLSIISLLTYIEPLIFGDYDFGMIFEILSLVFIFMARHYMSIYDEERSNRYTILAMIPIGWLLIYDLITILNVLDLILLEPFTIFNLIILFEICKDLRKADNPEKYKENTDWFYERLDKKNNDD